MGLRQRLSQSIADTEPRPPSYTSHSIHSTPTLHYPPTLYRVYRTCGSNIGEFIAKKREKCTLRFKRNHNDRKFGRSL